MTDYICFQPLLQEVGQIIGLFILNSVFTSGGIIFYGLRSFSYLLLNQPYMLYKFCVPLLFFACIHCSGKKETKPNRKTSVPTADAKVSEETKRTDTYAGRLLTYARQNGYATNLAFLVDMKASSGSNRFFVYSFEKKKIIHKGLVTHGNCGEAFLTERRYGNTVGCNCTSLGKYKIGKKYYGRFGLTYKLHGLESTNNKAFERFVVLHGHSCVPDSETKPFPICQSNGCPTVSPNFLETLATYINKSEKPILLWIYE
ncbi:MAG TPA: murein L,D-transpeptidase catalytic domain family protein [Lacibacter sp.]|nr:murein L,D-transpeptidase catalytic domain family protein [Lacibacter sp.]